MDNKKTSSPVQAGDVFEKMKAAGIDPETGQAVAGAANGGAGGSPDGAAAGVARGAGATGDGGSLSTGVAGGSQGAGATGNGGSLSTGAVGGARGADATGDGGSLSTGAAGGSQSAGNVQESGGAAGTGPGAGTSPVIEKKESIENVQPFENKMGWMDENKLLLSMSIPMMISMFVQALYNIVDSIFVANISENALTAVSLAFPIQNLIIAFSVGTCVGVNALLSRSLGEKNFAMANTTANNAILLGVITWLVFVVLGIVAITPFYTFQTDVTEIIDYGVVYLKFCTIGSLGIFMQIVFERLLQSTGRATLSMLVQMAGVVVNVVMDPILIFGLLGFPRLEVMGAAIATIAGQFVAAGLGLVLNLKYNPEIKLQFREILKPNARCIKQIYSVGAPSIIMNSVGSVMNFGMNKILVGFSTTAVAVFGVYFKIQSFFFMPVFGLNNGIVPIMAYNYGAKKGDRMMKTLKLGVFYATGLMILGFAVFMAIPGPLMKLFKASPNMLAMGIPCLRIICISFLLAGFCIICGSVFQALGNGMMSMWVSVARQLIVLLPVAYILAQFGNVNLVWWCYPISEIASAALSFIFIRKIIRTKIKPYMK